jgi:hypothetical protein
MHVDQPDCVQYRKITFEDFRRLDLLLSSLDDPFNSLRVSRDHLTAMNAVES